MYAKVLRTVWWGVVFSAQSLHIHLLWAALALSQQQSHLCDMLLWKVVAATDGRLLMRTKRRRWRSQSISDLGAHDWEMWHDLAVRAEQRRRRKGEQRWRTWQTSESVPLIVASPRECSDRQRKSWTRETWMQESGRLRWMDSLDIFPQDHPLCQTDHLL